LSHPLGAAAAAGALAAAWSPKPGKLWASVLEELPLFAGLSKRHVRKIAGLAHEARFREGTSIVRAGERGNDFFVIIHGSATVVPFRGPRVSIGPGDYFGEMSLIDGGERSATVLAESEMLCLRLSRVPFMKMLKGEPEISLALLRTLSQRVRRLQAQIEA
jgi:CRP/FNR family cyclic AMP-dependent transcriptional regulator